MKKHRPASLILLLAGAAVLATACGRSLPAPGRLEALGQPCRAKQVLAGRVVVDRRDGREWFVLTNDNETQGSELLFIDPATGEGRMIVAPAGAGSWALNEVRGDRLIVGTFYDGALMAFDLQTMAFVKTVKFPGEDYIWNLAVGSDGRLYGGTYPGGKLGALDLDTYALEDLGAPAPPNMYLRTVSATPEGLILCSFGQEKPATLLFDPGTKAFHPVPESLAGVTAGVAWNGLFLAGNRAFKGRAFTPVALPFPVPPADGGDWGVDTYLTTPETVHLRQGTRSYYFRKGDRALAFVADIDLRGGRLLAGNSKGELLGVRGQDYFVIKPGDKDLSLRPIPIEGRGRPTLFLEADEQGRLWGGPHFGQTLFRLDPNTGEGLNTGTVCDAGGEVYDVAFLDGKVYTASYAGGDITVYDPAAAWDQWGLKNPKPLAKVGPDFIRPAAGIVVGLDRKLYSGWMAKYGTYGGALAITDPATGATELVVDPLGAQAVMGLAVDNRFAYLGTTLNANGLPDKKNEAPKFGMLELATRKIVFERTFEGAVAVRQVAADAATGLVVLTVGDKLEIFDPAERTFRPASVGTPAATGYALAAPGRGVIFFGAGSALVACDLAAGRYETLAEAPRKITNVAVSPAGEIFVACEEDVYRFARGK